MSKAEHQSNGCTESNQKQAFRPHNVKCSIELSGETLKMETHLFTTGIQ